MQLVCARVRLQDCLDSRERFLALYDALRKYAGEKAKQLKPVWDNEGRELRFSDKSCKQFNRQPAKNQITILRTFEEDGWPRRIDDPLSSEPGKDPGARRRDTIRGLNTGLRILHFRGDGTGEGIIWERAPTKLP